MLQATFDFEGAASAPAPVAPKRRRKSAPAAPVVPPYWMLSTLNHPLAGPVQFLAADSYHHDRPDDALTGLTADPRQSPRFSTWEAAERAARRFALPDGYGWCIAPNGSTLMHPDVILGFLDRAGLPREHRTWGKLNGVGVFGVEIDGTVGRDATFRVTYSESHREYAMLHAVENALSQCYRVRLESVPRITSAGKLCGTEAVCVAVSGVRPQAEWFDPQA